MTQQPTKPSNTPKFPKRKRLRLSSYDYSSAGYYFVTICTHQKVCLFGEIINDAMTLNSIGQMISCIWIDLPQRFEQVSLNSFIVMPNHIHGILILKEGVSLSRVIQAYKSLCSNEYIRGVRQKAWKKIDHPFWQMSFYDHVIRNQEDLLRIQEYIVNNPLQWALDEENPDCKRTLKNGQTQGLTLQN